MNGEKTRFECFAGETKSLVLTIENEQENSEVSIAFVRGHTFTKKSFSTKDNTLAKDENGEYCCELSAADTVSMSGAEYAIEVKVESAAGVTIRPCGVLAVRKDQVYKL